MGTLSKTRIFLNVLQIVILTMILLNNNSENFDTTGLYFMALIVVSLINFGITLYEKHNKTYSFGFLSVPDLTFIGLFINQHLNCMKTMAERTVLEDIDHSKIKWLIIVGIILSIATIIHSFVTIIAKKKVKQVGDKIREIGSGLKDKIKTGEIGQEMKGRLGDVGQNLRDKIKTGEMRGMKDKIKTGEMRGMGQELKDKIKTGEMRGMGKELKNQLGNITGMGSGLNRDRTIVTL